MYIKKQSGFTIVELLIVIVVIGILAALVIGGYANAQKEARIAKVNSDLSAIKKSMLAYKQEIGELPPTGDFCNTCAGVTQPTSSWQVVVDDMQAKGYLGSDKPVKDPWGYYYGYDDNDCNSNPHSSNVRSIGPDGTIYTADDFYITVSRGCTES
jgi:general secretion pathway protein G